MYEIEQTMVLKGSRSWDLQSSFCQPSVDKNFELESPKFECPDACPNMAKMTYNQFGQK